MGETLYIKFETRCKASEGKVILGDVGEILCEDKAIQAKARAIKLMDMPKKDKYREVFSVLMIIEMIQKQCPGVTVDNVGSMDFIVEYSGQQKKGLLGMLKIFVIGIVVLFGSGFAIMTFNNDVAIPELFAKIYEMVPGTNPDGHILEICYSIGLTLGIVVFYNHFGGARFDSDPTPIEVQMRSYETDIDSAVIETAGRNGQEQNVS